MLACHRGTGIALSFRNRLQNVGVSGRRVFGYMANAVSEMYSSSVRPALR